MKNRLRSPQQPLTANPSPGSQSHCGLRMLLAVALCLSAVLMPRPAEAEVINEIVLRVNDRFATLYDYLELRGEMRMDILRSDIPPEEQARRLGQVPQMVMRSLFQDMLLLSRADQLQVFVSQEEIENEVLRMRADFGISSEDEFLQALAQSGITLAKLRQQVEQTLMMRQVIGREVQNQLEVEDDELRRFYRDNPDLFEVDEQRRAKEIVVLETSNLDADGRRVLAEGLYQRLTNGESLAAVVDEYAPDGRVSSVIHLDWVNPGDLDSALESALWQLGPGDYSRPVSARGGLHILQLLDVKESTMRPFDEVKDWIRANLQNERYSEIFANYVRDLEQTAYIVDQAPEEAAGYRTEAPQGPVTRDPFQIRGEDPSGRLMPAPAEVPTAEVPAAEVPATEESSEEAAPVETGSTEEPAADTEDAGSGGR